MIYCSISLFFQVANMAGIAVTPVVGFIGELNDLVLNPNKDEVEEGKR